MNEPILKLILAKGPREGETIDARPGSAIRIGRVVKGNTFAVKDAGISSKHILVEFRNGNWVVFDLETSNGTLLNNLEVTPMTPFDLRDGDVIKIGEFTSIKVKIGEESMAEFQAENCENRLRRNPRRRATSKGNRALKDEAFESGLVPENGRVQETMVSIAENRDCRQAVLKRTRDEPSEFALASVAEKPGSSSELESVAIVTDNSTQQAAPRRTRASKNRPVESVSANTQIGEEFQAENGENRLRRNPRRGATSKGNKALKEETFGTVLVPEICREPENNAVAPVEQMRRQRGALKRTWASKNEDSSYSVSEVQKIPENFVLGEENWREPENAAPMDEKQIQEEVPKRAKSSDDKTSKSVPVHVSEAQKIHKGSNLDQEICKGSESSSAIKENTVEFDNGKTLEKMTLGEWFDYLEVNLPKQISEITEETISIMRDRATQFHEFILQLQIEKGKLAVA